MNTRRLVGVVGLIVAGFARPAAAETLETNYAGAFVLTFGTGPDGTNDLWFAGAGPATPLGPSLVFGHSTTRPDPANPLVSVIVTDAVVLVDAHGDQLWLENAGSETLDPSVPGRLFIRGSGTFRVTGGTGRYRRATGSGEFEVVAEVLQQDPSGAWAGGSFQLSFAGEVNRRR